MWLEIEGGARKKDEEAEEEREGEDGQVSILK